VRSFRTSHPVQGEGDEGYRRKPRASEISEGAQQVPSPPIARSLHTTFRYLGGTCCCAPCSRDDLSIGLIPVSLVAVMTQTKFAADFAAEAAAPGGITAVTLIASGFVALVAYVLILPVTLVASGFVALVAYVLILPVTLVASGFLTLIAYVLILRGCRRPDVRGGSDLRRFNPRRPRFRGRGWLSVRRTRLFSHEYHATEPPTAP
jgi:hypothetical protein